MIRIALSCLCMMILLSMNACIPIPSWKHTSGSQLLSTAGRAADARRFTFTVPEGWHWFIRGEDMIATRDGVFLQHIFIERIHVDQVDQNILGTFWLVAWSSKQWPTRTVKSLKKRFTPAMSPDDAAEVLLGSRKNDPGVTNLKVQELAKQTIAGHQAFRMVFDFRLNGSAPFYTPSPLYRSIYYGFMVDDWFYGISYTAALRYYFQKDSQTFEAFLESIQLVENE